MKKRFLCLFWSVAIFVSGVSAASPINSSKDMSFIFVPFPCPSQDTYKVAEVNMDAIIGLMATSKVDFEIIIVLAPYAAMSNEKYLDSTEWWGPTIKQLKDRYSWTANNGFIKFVNSLDEAFLSSINFDGTPYMFYFEKGKFVDKTLMQDSFNTVLLDIFLKR